MFMLLVLVVCIMGGVVVVLYERVSVYSQYSYYPEVCQLAGSGNIRGRAISEKVHRYQYVLVFTLNIRSMYTYLLPPRTLMKGNKVP
jgi:hypothetical protein